VPQRWRRSSSANDDDDLFKRRLLPPWIAAAAPLVAIASLAWLSNPSTAVSAAATAVYHSEASIHPALLAFLESTGTTVLVGFASSFVGWFYKRLNARLDHEQKTRDLELDRATKAVEDISSMSDKLLYHQQQRMVDVVIRSALRRLQRKQSQETDKEDPNFSSTTTTTTAALDQQQWDKDSLRSFFSDSVRWTSSHTRSIEPTQAGDQSQDML
jgi:hypothetical protein